MKLPALLGCFYLASLASCSNESEFNSRKSNKEASSSSEESGGQGSLKEGSSLESEDETVTQPSEVAGSFLTTICTPELGGLNCVVRDENGKLIDFSDNGLSYKPDYDLYLTKDLAKDTPESIEASIASGIG